MAVEASADAVLVQDFANTRDLRTFIPRGHPYRDGTGDELASVTSSRDWLTERRLLPEGSNLTESDRARVLALRTALRAGLDPREERLDDVPRYALPLRVELDAAGGPRLTAPGNGVDQAIGEISAAALRTALTGEWWRLRICSADDCRWVFYDQSKPGRGRYCAPDSCGNRVKTRAYRRRKADHSGDA
ncbi:MAG: CGNR zinc finger domain-containing protein [Nocardioidaceae bacterium]